MQEKKLSLLKYTVPTLKQFFGSIPAKALPELNFKLMNLQRKEKGGPKLAGLWNSDKSSGEESSEK